MNPRKLLTLAVLAAVLAPLPAAAAPRRAAKPLRVACTIPDLADIAKRIGGDRVETHSFARGTENVHSVRLRPSDLNFAARADMFVEMGLSLEHAYVPGLLETCRNPAIQPGAPGFVNCSDGWKPIEIPGEISRANAADLHPFGNPHFNLDPHGGRQMATKIFEGLCRVSPGDKDAFQTAYDSYLKELDAAEARWDAAAAALKGKKVMLYHPDFDYFVESRGMEMVGTIEPRAGVPPTPKDLAHTIDMMKAQGIQVILTAAWSNNRNTAFVAQRTGAKVVELPAMVGGEKGADTWIHMMDMLHSRLTDAFGVTPAAVSGSVGEGETTR